MFRAKQFILLELPAPEIEGTVLPPPQIGRYMFSYDMFYTPTKASFFSIKFLISLFLIVIFKYEKYIQVKKIDASIRISH